VTTQPQYPAETDQITITFDVTNTNPTGKTPLKNYTGNVYVHTGVYINNDNSTWLYVIGTWGNNTTQPQVTYISANKYQLVINNPRSYYGVTSSLQTITSLCFVLRSSDGTKQTEDIHVTLYSAGISIIINSPSVNLNYGDPERSPVFVSAGSTLPISVSTSAAGAITLYVNGVQKTQSASSSLSYSFVVNDYPASKNQIRITAVDNANNKDTVTFTVMRNPAIKSLPLPSGNQAGINYGSDPTKVTLALYAPKKSYVYVIGDFGSTDWKVDTAYFMNRYEVKTDSVIWWTTISNLEIGKEYSFQYLVDGALRIYDPYTEKVLDKDNDSYIPSTVYPDLKAYPSGKTGGLVSVLQTNQTAYSWNVSSFSRPAKEKLVIYEMLVRDFVSTHSYKTIIDTLSYLKRLGINAIELMPISEFEGNDSWGYNPASYFAPDKYYGTKNDLKALIDACHQKGIAVVQDIVLNHAYNSNSMAQLYWDSTNSRPASNNPWFNTTSPNTSYSWGNDFNHESKDTKCFVDRVTSFWLTEYKVDGFRFDFSKGFTNTSGDGSAYDASRIAILKRIADKIWNVSSGAYVILEHFTANSEEMELANYGLMLWGNMNSSYSEAAMGYVSSSNINNVSYKQRGWTLPNLIGYMESHDEERLTYKNITYGNSGSSYNIKTLTTALNRIQLAANLFFLVPGPKMVWQFGELGYDYSINYPSLTSSDRLTAKPIKWDYYYDMDRRNVYKTFTALSNMKSRYPAFSSADYNLNGSGAVKSLYINHSSMNAVAVGNFDVSSQDYTVAFQSTGKWYEYYSGDSLTVSNVNVSISLQPGEYRLYTSQRITKSDVGVGIQNEKSIPEDFCLNQNYPNPFNPGTVISYKLPAAGHVTLKIYDLLGREIATLVDEYKDAGIHNARFSIFNYQLSSGVYFYRLHTGKYVSAKKMVILK